MNSSNLRQVLGKIDGSRDALVQALTTLIHAAETDEQAVSKSQEHFFYEEMSKTILNWIAKGDADSINGLLHDMDDILAKEDEMSSAMLKLNLKKRLGVQLIIFSELIGTYMRSDLIVKDQQAILLTNDKVQKRLREILFFFFQKQKSLTQDDLKELKDQNGYGNSDEVKLGTLQKAIQRDIKKLVEKNLLYARPVNKKQTQYALSNRAYQYKDAIITLRNLQQASGITMAPEEEITSGAGTAVSHPQYNPDSSTDLIGQTNAVSEDDSIWELSKQTIHMPYARFGNKPEDTFNVSGADGVIIASAKNAERELQEKEMATSSVGPLFGRIKNAAEDVSRAEGEFEKDGKEVYSSKKSHPVKSTIAHLLN